MIKLIAQNTIPLGSFKGVGSGVMADPGAAAGSIFNKFLSGAIGIITIVGAIWFTITLISGAIGIMTAGSDKAAVESARKRITSGLIGLLVLVAGIFILDLVGKILGIESILNPGTFIENFSLSK